MDAQNEERKPRAGQGRTICPDPEAYEGLRIVDPSFVRGLVEFFRRRTLPEILAILALVSLVWLAYGLINAGEQLTARGTYAALAIALMISATGIVALVLDAKKRYAKDSEKRPDDAPEFGDEEGGPPST